MPASGWSYRAFEELSAERPLAIAFFDEKRERLAKLAIRRNVKKIAELLQQTNGFIARGVPKNKDDFYALGRMRRSVLEFLVVVYRAYNRARGYCTAAGTLQAHLRIVFDMDKQLTDMICQYNSKQVVR